MQWYKFCWQNDLNLCSNQEYMKKMLLKIIWELLLQNTYFSAFVDKYKSLNVDINWRQNNILKSFVWNIQ